MRPLRARLRALVRRWRRPSSWERSLDDELHAYLDGEIDVRIRAGMAPGEARRTALAEFGGVEQVKEQVRASATGAWLDVLGQDLRYAVRALQHSRGFTALVMGSLAIGMAVTVAALAFLNASMLRPFPAVTSQDRLVRVAAIRQCGRPDCRVRMSSTEDYEALANGLTGLQGLTAYTFAELAVALPAPRSMRGILTSANYFDVLGVGPSPGRGFAAADAETHAQVAVIAHHVWTQEFASDPSVVGRFISVANESVQIVGVAPPYFIGIDRIRPGNRPPDVWLPFWLAEHVLPLARAEADDAGVAADRSARREPHHHRWLRGRRHL